MSEPTDQREMDRLDHERAMSLLRAYGAPDPNCKCLTCTFAHALLRMKAAVDKAPHAPDCKSNSSHTVKCRNCGIDAALCPSDVKCFGHPDHDWKYRGLRPCNCWKAELL